MDNDEQRDFAEEAYNCHIQHTGDGEVKFCDVPTCPYYILNLDIGEDKLFYDIYDETPAWGKWVQVVEYIGKHRR